MTALAPSAGLYKTSDAFPDNNNNKQPQTVTKTESYSEAGSLIGLNAMLTQPPMQYNGILARCKPQTDIIWKA